MTEAPQSLDGRLTKFNSRQYNTVQFLSRYTYINQQYSRHDIIIIIITIIVLVMLNCWL